LTADDWEAVLRKYPQQLRQGLSDEGVARDLELQAWAFDYHGGPLRTWLEFEESGQSTMGPRSPARGYGDWVCEPSEGHLVFAVGRGASERMKRIMQQLGEDAYPESIVFRMKVGAYSFLMSDGGEPLWFRWHGVEKRFAVQTHTIEKAADGEELTLLRVECTEADPQPPDKPRKVTLMLKESFGKAGKK
jgi:hypothetical protein